MTAVPNLLSLRVGNQPLRPVGVERDTAPTTLSGDVVHLPEQVDTLTVEVGTTRIRVDRIEVNRTSQLMPRVCFNRRPTSINQHLFLCWRAQGLANINLN